jgi:integrase
MNYKYGSLFAEDIGSFISFKRSLGYAKSSYDKFMYIFDKFCIEKYPLTDELTQAVVDSWSLPRKGEHPNGIKRRLSAIRQFGQYLNYMGKVAYVVPSKLIGAYRPFVPYIYDDKELKAFFMAADSIPPLKQSPFREFIVPVMFRLQYCCGLRPSELRHIKQADMDYNAGVLKIVESKNYRDRNVVLSNDLLGLCRRYEDEISARQPGRHHYFEHPKGGAYSANWIQAQFRICWRKSGITFRDRRNPRVYDARHNYATRIMAQWMDEDRDVNALLPYLSEYMGHSSLADTAYYLHLLPERISAMTFTHMTGVFPEVPNDC